MTVATPCMIDVTLRMSEQALRVLCKTPEQLEADLPPIALVERAPGVYQLRGTGVDNWLGLGPDSWSDSAEDRTIESPAALSGTMVVTLRLSEKSFDRLCDCGESIARGLWAPPRLGLSDLRRDGTYRLGGDLATDYVGAYGAPIIHADSGENTYN